MDRFDAAILDAIQTNNRLTAEALSKLVHLSPDSCRKRLARLRSEGYIDADIAVLNPARLGRGLIVIVEVALTSERPADLDRFREKMKAAPEVMQCYYITGASDFLLILSASDMADYDAFTRRYFFAEENIMKFRTSVVMDRVKTGFSIPLPFPHDDGTRNNPHRGQPASRPDRIRSGPGHALAADHCSFSCAVHRARRAPRPALAPHRRCALPETPARTPASSALSLRYRHRAWPAPGR
jgi:Lrp/AsnC family leucine-responsive transcriptional regulator